MDKLMSAAGAASINKEIVLGYIVDSDNESFSVLICNGRLNKPIVKLPKNEELLDSGCYDKYRLYAFSIVLGDNGFVSSWDLDNVYEHTNYYSYYATLGDISSDNSYSILDISTLCGDDYAGQYDYIVNHIKRCRHGATVLIVDGIICGVSHSPVMTSIGNYLYLSHNAECRGNVIYAEGNEVVLEFIECPKEPLLLRKVDNTNLSSIEIILSFKESHRLEELLTVEGFDKVYINLELRYPVSVKSFNVLNVHPKGAIAEIMHCIECRDGYERGEYVSWEPIDLLKELNWQMPIIKLVDKIPNHVQHTQILEMSEIYHETDFRATLDIIRLLSYGKNEIVYIAVKERYKGRSGDPYIIFEFSCPEDFEFHDEAIWRCSYTILGNYRRGPESDSSALRYYRRANMKGYEPILQKEPKEFIDYEAKDKALLESILADAKTRGRR